MMYQQTAEYCPHFGFVILMDYQLSQYFVNIRLPHLLTDFIKIWWPIAAREERQDFLAEEGFWERNQTWGIHQHDM